ncbi:MAG: hypothetical protein IPK13_07870 [Deltaproteobacteria bacterium]|nr:hypothetical protein [Deltaproteobacteria bacterium]
MRPSAGSAPARATPTRSGPVFGGNARHFEGKAVFSGPYRISPRDLEDRFAGCPSEQYFGVVVFGQDGATRIIRDNQFTLPNLPHIDPEARGKVGLHLLGTKDLGVPESYREIDDALYRAYGIEPPATEDFHSDPANYHKKRIYASIHFWHPEHWKSPDLAHLARVSLGTESRQTHEGAYLGRDETTNAPANYHSHGWNADGYPCHVLVHRLAGVDSETFNWNGYCVDKVLNRGVKFPPDYHKDVYRTHDLNTALMFFRDWVLEDRGHYLRSDPTWATYCAEHKNIVRIVQANVPQNLESYVEVFGPDDGPELWDAMTRPGGAFELSHGLPWRTEYETHFDPLWKLEGLHGYDPAHPEIPSEIRPWKDLSEYEAHNNAWNAGPEAYQRYLDEGGFAGSGEARGLPYASESSSDLMMDFVETYASFEQAGGVEAALAALAFEPEIVARMQIDAATFMSTALPIAAQLIAHEALVVKKEGVNGMPVPLAMWAKGVRAELVKAMGLQPSDPPDDPRNAVIEALLQGVGHVDADPGPGLSRRDAYVQLRRTIAPQLDAARDVRGGPGAIMRNAPPALALRAVQNPASHPTSPFVSIQYACTVIGDDELVAAS